MKWITLGAFIYFLLVFSSSLIWAKGENDQVKVVEQKDPSKGLFPIMSIRDGFLTCHTRPEREIKIHK